MADLFLFNSLSRKKEKFVPLKKDGRVGMYTCGPTVYDYASIGNFRTYLTSDLLLRILEFNGFQVDYYMNLTDVGHLTGDNLGDADLGEDRMEKAAQRQGKTAWDIANFYIQAFLTDFEKLNLKKPQQFPRATEHIQEQIDLVKRIEAKGFTYRTSDGIYFDTQKYEKETGKKYGLLSDLSQIKEGARVEKNPEKKDPRDFALWKFSQKPGERQMEWESPWGLGFPGWHIECSAMSMKYLSESFDLHLGGEDLRQTHHPNEIAQAESVTDKPFVKYWLHTTFLKVDGKRMGKSLGNFYTVSDLEKKGFDPLSLRYLYLTAHYRDPLNFTWESLGAAEKTLQNLKSLVASFKKQVGRTTLSPEKEEKINRYQDQFLIAINDDLNLPQALVVVWEMLKSNVPSTDKYDLAISFDEVLGLKLNQPPTQEPIPGEIQKLVGEREKMRQEQKFEEGDQIRKQIEERGFLIQDTDQGSVVRKKSPV